MSPSKTLKSVFTSPATLNVALPGVTPDTFSTCNSLNSTVLEPMSYVPVGPVAIMFCTVISPLNVPPGNGSPDGPVAP